MIVFGVALLTNISYASQATPATYPIYVTNKTPYNLTIGASFWGVTPLDILVAQLPPNSPETLVAQGKAADNKISIAYYLHLGDQQKAGYNTILMRNYVRLDVYDEHFTDSITPTNFYVDGKTYSISIDAWDPTYCKIYIQ